MPTPEAFEKFLEDVDRQISEADASKKQSADNTLKAIAKLYNERIRERIAAELAAAEACKQVGDDIGSNHHLALAEIYKSLFNVHANTAGRQ